MTKEEIKPDAVVALDNEETGSGTKQGAGSNFLMSLIQRIVMAQGGCLDDYFRSVEIINGTKIGLTLPGPFSTILVYSRSIA